MTRSATLVPDTIAEPGGPAEPDWLFEAEVEDVTGHQKVRITGLAPETPMSDVIGLSTAGMTLPSSVDWLARDRPSARILRKDDPISKVARGRKAELVLHPDARLG